jgi:S-DNA-T family DNA segregation ATPase FtsK/SpoIIIE
MMWEKALKGLQDARPVSLDRFATYVLMIRQAVEEEGQPLLLALGWALPALRMPRDSALFEAIPERFRNHADRWKRLYQQGFNKRATYLTKVTPTQQPILPDQLRDHWRTVADEIDPVHHPVCQAFIEAPGKWTPEAAALCDLEWERDNISALFAGLKTRKQPLGEETFGFFEDEFPDTLTEAEEDYLRRLDRRRTREPNEEDEEFYERHRAELNKQRTLKSKWDRFIYGQPIETDDFIVGLLRCLERLFEQAGPVAESRMLTITSNRKTPKDWLDMHHRAAMYFSRRYRGVQHLTSRLVNWDVGGIFDFETIVERRRQRGGFEPTRSTARVNNQVRFYVTLECTTGGNVEPYAVQMIWQFNPNSICSEFAEDWERLTQHPLVLSRVAREPVSKKGQLQAIDLSDVSTLMPVFRQLRGSLIPAYSREEDLAYVIPIACDEARKQQRVTEHGHTALNGAWEQFAHIYQTALSDCFSEGVSSAACLDVEDAYVRLLGCLNQHAPGDGNRKDLWEPILRLGIATVDGGPPAAIVAPWHPLRLLGMAARTRQVCGLIRHLLQAPTVDFGDARLFFQDLAEELKHPYYPEVCLGMDGRQPILLSLSDTVADYTLMESPVADLDEDSTNENPAETARHILKIVRRYLELQPHESANLSLVLYDCDSARLPEATVDALGNLYEEDDEVRCQIILRHHNTERLHQLYEKLLEGSEGDTDSFISSEASRDFMARLRIGVMADSAPIHSSEDGPPADIVFLQDVIARLADATWLQEPVASYEPELLHHVPSRHSRRRPATKDDLRSVLYLACPTQPRIGWRYLQALHGVIEGTESDLTAKPTPARQISFQHNDTQTIFEEIHRLGHWVVNSDDLLTRRQLRNQGVHVIRYQQQRHGERNVIISSKAPLNLLEVMVQRRLQSLNLDIPGDELRALTQRMVDDASSISGDIVLRAAKRGQFASELVGLVLSRFLLHDELGASSHCGWYFLDDYANWLGQKEQHLADVMAISPQRDGDKILLIVLISEAKYITRTALADARRSSAVQLRETLSRMQEALFGSPSRLDRDLWLSRLSDVILDGIEVPATEGMSLHEWRDAIRTGTADILLKGYSHVFVHTQEPDDRDPAERVPIGNVDDAWQEVFGREQVRRLALAYHQHQSPREIRSALGDDRPWAQGVPVSPSTRVLWTATPPLTTPPQDQADGREDATWSAPPERAAPQEPLDPLPSSAPQAQEASLVGISAAPSDAEQTEPTVTEPTHSDFAWTAPHERRALNSLVTENGVSSHDEGWLGDTVSKLRTALLSYHLQAKVLGQRLTPNAALIQLQGSDRLRTTDVEHRRNELLTTHGLQITNVLAEPGRVIVSVARPHRQIVSLIDTWRHRQVDSTSPRSNQNLVLGVRESDGEMLYLSPGALHAPHTLIAGTTGSGKSVLIQNLLLDIASTNDCAHARILLIDPKQGVDYLDLQTLPHLQDGIIVSQEAARVALENAVAEMERRYDLFRSAGVANLARYNRQASPERCEPVLWIIHDEFAGWMLMDDYKETVSSTVQRLGVMARAAGIFLIFAAQRPEDRVMPLQLRDNLGNRLILRVESPGTSKIALGEEGAERLLGKGHLAARLPDEERIIHAQVPMLPPDTIRTIVASIREDCAVQATH